MRMVGTLVGSAFRSVVALSLVACAMGCGSNPGTDVVTEQVDLLNRAYIVSKDSGDVTVIDLKGLTIIGSLDIKGRQDHMAELNADFTKGYVDSPGTNESVVF